MKAVNTVDLHKSKSESRPHFANSLTVSFFFSSSPYFHLSIDSITLKRGFRPSEYSDDRYTALDPQDLYRKNNLANYSQVLVGPRLPPISRRILLAL